MKFEKISAKIILYIGYLIGIGGILNILGWQFDVTIFKSLFPDIAPMHPLIALMFLLSSLWIILYTLNGNKYILLILCSVITITGFIHCFSYFLPLNFFRYDNLLFDEKIKNSINLIKVAPNTSFVIFLCGIVMLLTKKNENWIQIIRQSIICIGFVMVYVSFLGYIYNISNVYKFGKYTPMAFLSAILFLFLHTGLFLSNTTTAFAKTFSSPLNGGKLLRRAIPFILCMPIFTGYLKIWGETNGLYTPEFGLGVYTMIFTLSLFLFMGLYAALENKQNKLKIETEKQITESEHKLKDLFNTLVEGVITFDLLGTIMFCNPALCVITGYKENELIGKNIPNLLIPISNRTEFNNLISLKNGFEGITTMEIVRKDGHKIKISLKSRPLLDKNNCYSSGSFLSVCEITNNF